MNEQNDRELVERCLRGEGGSFRELVERYEKPVFNLAYRISGNTDDAADITQSTFVKVFENLTSFDPHRKFFSWLYRIALNEGLNFKRAQKNTSDVAETIVSDDTSIHDTIERQEEQERIGEALHRIDENFRIVIVLHYFAECSYDDISYILNIPERTVKSRLYEARERLRRILMRPTTA
jgi:RNA polymerase sigma-70 factor (ECF subfamily)